MSRHRTPGRMITIVLFLSLLVGAPAFGITGSQPYQALIPTINKLLQKQGSPRRLAKNAAYNDVVNTLMTLRAGPGLPPGQVAVPAAQLNQLLAQIPAAGAAIGAKIQKPTTLPAAVQIMTALPKAIQTRILAAEKAGHPALSAKIMADMITNTNAISATVLAPDLPATATIDQVSTTLGTLPRKIAAFKPSPTPTPGGLGAGQVAVVAADLTATLAAVHAVQTAVAGKPGGAPAPAAPANLQAATTALTNNAGTIGRFRVLAATQTAVENAVIATAIANTNTISVAVENRGGARIAALPAAATVPQITAKLGTIGRGVAALPAPLLPNFTAVADADITTVGARIHDIGALIGGVAAVAAPATINAAAGDLQTIFGAMPPRVLTATQTAVENAILNGVLNEIHEVQVAVAGRATAAAGAAVAPAAQPATIQLAQAALAVERGAIAGLPILPVNHTAVANADIANTIGNTNDISVAVNAHRPAAPAIVALAANAPMDQVAAKLGDIRGAVAGLPVLAAGDTAVNVATAQARINGMRALFGLAPVAPPPPPAAADIAADLQATLVAMTPIVAGTVTATNLVTAALGGKIAGPPTPPLAPGSTIENIRTRLAALSPIIVGLDVLRAGEAAVNVATAQAEIEAIETLLTAPLPPPPAGVDINAALVRVHGKLTADIAQVRSKLETLMSNVGQVVAIPSLLASHNALNRLIVLIPNGSIQAIGAQIAALKDSFEHLNHGTMGDKRLGILGLNLGANDNLARELVNLRAITNILNPP